MECLRTVTKKGNLTNLIQAILHYEGKEHLVIDSQLLSSKRRHTLKQFISIPKFSIPLKNEFYSYVNKSSIKFFQLMGQFYYVTL